MKFGPLPTANSLNSILAHSIRISGLYIQKGKIINSDDIQKLESIGINEITVATLESNDAHEDKAANDVANASIGTNIISNPAHTGRTNLLSTTDGILSFKESVINNINEQHEAVTLATLANHSIVKSGQMIATIKIITFSAPNDELQRIIKISVKNSPIFRISPFRNISIGLIQSRSNSLKESILEKTTKTMSQRINSYKAYLKEEIRCEHNIEEVSKSISTLLNQDCKLIIVVGASAIVDRRDIIPKAIEINGGSIDRLGMPVDPGNLLLLGRIGKVQIIGAPGCARSSKFNGFDNVLAQLIANYPINNQSIGLMGPGGLLQEHQQNVSRIQFS